jgi:hypothetical protein
MKHLKQLSWSLFFFIGCFALTNCSETDTAPKPCLPNQFPFEGNSSVTANYDTKNRLFSLAYKILGDGATYESFRYYTDNKVTQIIFKVNGFFTEDYVRVKHLVDTVKEEYFRGNANVENLKSYRLYFFNENEKMYSYTVREKANDFVRSDSVVYSYTAENVTQITVYNNVDAVEATFVLTYDDKINPYHRSGFGGDDYLYSYLNLSKNNLVSITHVEDNETITYEYTYSAKGVPLTRKVSADTEPQEFKYTCDNP